VTPVALGTPLQIARHRHPRRRERRSTRQSVADGIASVYSPHTTCCISVNGFESGFLEDFSSLLERLVPNGGDHYHAHDDWDRRTENICQKDRPRTPNTPLGKPAWKPRALPRRLPAVSAMGPLGFEPRTNRL
jgi:hypothetical protein